MAALCGYPFSSNSIFTVLQHKKAADSLLMSCSSRSPDAEVPASPKYSDRLSPAINTYLSEASRQEIRVRFSLRHQFINGSCEFRIYFLI